MRLYYLLAKAAVSINFSSFADMLSFVVQDSINDWTCHSCKNFPHVTATTFHGKIKDANGFVAYDSDANEIIVSFSGTDPLSIQNWIDDLDFIQTAYPYCSGCQVHEGFYKSFNSVVDQVKSLVNSFLASHPSARLTVTGHSLGAAMAAHCTAELKHSGYNITTSYTFGMPRVGNQAFSDWYKSSANIPGTYRVVHNHDPVPHVPWEKMDFHHMPYEVFYKNDYKSYVVCNFEGEDSSCANQYVKDLNVGKLFLSLLALFVAY
jgi:predicted lipase